MVIYLKYLLCSIKTEFTFSKKPSDFHFFCYWRTASHTVRSVLWVRLQEALNEIISILSYHLLIVVILRPITEPDPGWLVQPQNVGIIIPREIVRSCGFPIGIHSAGPIFREEGQC